MSQFLKLCRVLEKELAIQEKMLELLGRERAAIAKLDQERVHALREDKEKIVHQAKGLETDRSELLQSLAKEDPQAESPKLSAFLERCQDKQTRAKLEKAGLDLKETVAAVKLLNEQNGALIKQSLGLIASTLAILRARPETTLPVYGQGGKLSSTQEDPAFTNVPSTSFSRSA